MTQVGGQSPATPIYKPGAHLLTCRLHSCASKSASASPQQGADLTGWTITGLCAATLTDLRVWTITGLCAAPLPWQIGNE